MDATNTTLSPVFSTPGGLTAYQPGGDLMEGLPADGPALTETEQEGWANLGLQPPAQLEPLLEEQ